MSSPRLSIYLVVALFGASNLVLNSLPAQTAANPAVPAPAKSALAIPPVPPLASIRSPISFFRELLAMDAAGRELALTNRPPESRKVLLAKVREYESLPPDERELRLRVTELRWYLRPLMTAPATNRPAQLAAIPETYRKLIEDRLQEWDKLPTQTQTELLANEAIIRYLTEIEGRTADQRRQTLAAIPPASRTVLEKGIDRWDSMSEDQRRQMLGRFREFFELTAQEKQRALNTLPGPERGQVEKTLRGFDNLPPDQRAQCIRSFEKFAGLSIADRQQFLKSAEHWKQLSPDERQAWREVVRRLPPRLPPPLPPMPLSSHSAPPVPPIATNQN